MNTAKSYDEVIGEYYERKFKEGFAELVAQLEQKYGLTGGAMTPNEYAKMKDLESVFVEEINTQLRELQSAYTRFQPSVSTILYQPDPSDLQWLNVVENLKKIIAVKTGLNAFVKNNSRTIRAAIKLRQFVPGLLISKFGTGADGVIAATNKTGEFLDTRGNVIPPDRLIEALNNADNDDETLPKVKLIKRNFEFKSTEVDNLEEDVAKYLLSKSALFNKKKSVRKNHFSFNDKDLYDGFCFIFVDAKDETKSLIVYSFDELIEENLKGTLNLLKRYFRFTEQLDTLTENENIANFNNFNAFDFKIWMMDANIKWNFVFDQARNDFRMFNEPLETFLYAYLDKDREFLIRRIYPTVKSWAIKFDSLSISALSQIALKNGELNDVKDNDKLREKFLRRIINAISGFRFNNAEMDLVLENLKKRGHKELDKLFSDDAKRITPKRLQ